MDELPNPQMTPLDVVKVRLQAQQKEMVHSKCFTYCNTVVEDFCCCVNGVIRNGTGSFETSRPLTGTKDAFLRIARSEGLVTLWSGLPPTLLMSVPSTVIYFTVYDQLKDICSTQLSLQSSVAGPMLAGASARVVAVTCISPLEMVRTAMQSKKLSYLEMGQALRDQVQSKGIGSMWRGLVPTIWRDVPFS
ncbi:SLC25A40, partial [Cordylochernes scorpioides]